jgi:serine/threonine-protein kinase
MNVSSTPVQSREEVRRRFLALAQASRDGGPPPDLDSLVASLPEPERSELRSELASLSRSVAGGATADLVAPSDATVDHVPAAPPPAAAPAAVTTDLAADQTADFAGTPPQADGTGEYTPVATGVPEGTVDFRSGADQDAAAPADAAPGATGDYQPSPPRKSGSASARKAANLVVPQSVAGYDVLGVLGRGAMGVVYKARQRGLNRLVALKMILSGEHAGSNELMRFQAEAEAVAHLHHPNIVQIYEVGEEGGLPFFSLEFVDGSSLDKKVNGTPMQPKEAAALTQKLAQAMDYAHKNNIIHRDLKPGNVLIAEDGTPKVGDFGLAKRLDLESGQTRSGTVVGTASYMAPEQAEGRIRDVGPLSDEYSLGAILYELLTGRPPFKGSTFIDTLNQLRTLEPVPPMDFQPGVPRDLETICLKCLQKDAAKRYPSAGALADDLRRFLAGEPIVARPVGYGERLWRWCKRNPRVAGLTAAVIGLVLIGVIGLTVAAAMLKNERDQTEEARKEAVKNEEEARKQEGIAKEREKEAKEKEAIAKATADKTMMQHVDLGKNLYSLALQASPESRPMRDKVLGVLRQSLLLLGQTVEGYGATEFGTVKTCQHLGELLLDIGQTQESKKILTQGYETVKKLVEADPRDDAKQANLASIIRSLGVASLHGEGDARTARDRYVEARDVNEAIFKRTDRRRTDMECRQALSHDDIHLGWALVALGQSAEAARYFEESRKYRKVWLDSDADSWEAQNYVMQSEGWLGLTSAYLGDEKGMRDHFKTSLELGEALIKKYAWRAGFKVDMAEMLALYGDGLLRLGKAEEAEKRCQEALAYLKPVVDANPNDMSQQPLLAQLYEQLGAASKRLGKRPEAEEHYQKALKLRTDLLMVANSNVPRKAAYVLALARASKIADAAAGAAKVQPQVGQSSSLLLQIARCYATCAAADAPQKAEYVKRALEAVGAAAGEDFRDAVALQNDPDLEPVRGEPGFKAIVERVKGR